MPVPGRQPDEFAGSFLKKCFTRQDSHLVRNIAPRTASVKRLGPSSSPKPAEPVLSEERKIPRVFNPRDLFGTPGRIRTCDLQSRSLTLYPTELRALNAGYINILPRESQMILTRPAAPSRPRRTGPEGPSARGARRCSHGQRRFRSRRCFQSAVPAQRRSRGCRW